MEGGDAVDDPPLDEVVRRLKLPVCERVRPKLETGRPGGVDAVVVVVVVAATATSPAGSSGMGGEGCKGAGDEMASGESDSPDTSSTLRTFRGVAGPLLLELTSSESEGLFGGESDGLGLGEEGMRGLRAAEARSASRETHSSGMKPPTMGKVTVSTRSHPGRGSLGSRRTTLVPLDRVTSRRLA